MIYCSFNPRLHEIAPKRMITWEGAIIFSFCYKNIDFGSRCMSVPSLVSRLVIGAMKDRISFNRFNVRQSWVTCTESVITKLDNVSDIGIKLIQGGVEVFQGVKIDIICKNISLCRIEIGSRQLVSFINQRYGHSTF